VSFLHPPLEGEGRLTLSAAKCETGWGDSLSTRALFETRDRHPTPLAARATLPQGKRGRCSFMIPISNSARIHVRILAARCARGLHQLRPLEKRGRRESRAPIAPAVVRTKRTSRPQVNRIIRLSLHDGLRLIRAHPGDRAFLPPSLHGLTIYRKPGWAGHISAKLDASVGASGPHDFAVRACLAKALAGPRTHPASFVEDS